jgi:hypothetical protein
MPVTGKLDVGTKDRAISGISIMMISNTGFRRSLYYAPLQLAVLVDVPRPRINRRSKITQKLLDPDDPAAVSVDPEVRISV